MYRLACVIIFLGIAAAMLALISPPKARPQLHDLFQIIQTCTDFITPLLTRSLFLYGLVHTLRPSSVAYSQAQTAGGTSKDSTPKKSTSTNPASRDATTTTTNNKHRLKRLPAAETKEVKPGDAQYPQDHRATPNLNCS
jgi:hypothetical protein